MSKCLYQEHYRIEGNMLLNVDTTTYSLLNGLESSSFVIYF